MTDLEKFLDTYKQFGIELEVVDWVSYKEVTLSVRSDKFGGYDGAFSILAFDKNGKFIEQSFWSDY